MQTVCHDKNYLLLTSNLSRRKDNAGFRTNGTPSTSECTPKVPVYLLGDKTTKEIQYFYHFMFFQVVHLKNAVKIYPQVVLELVVVVDTTDKKFEAFHSHYYWQLFRFH